MANRHRRATVLVVAAWLVLAQVTGAAALSLDLCCPPAAADGHACCEGMSAGLCPMHRAAAEAGHATGDAQDATPSCDRGCGSHEALLGLVLSAPGVIPATATLSRPLAIALPARPGGHPLRSCAITPPAPPPWR